MAWGSLGTNTSIPGGEPFEVPWPFLALHSPQWAEKLAEDDAWDDATGEWIGMGYLGISQDGNAWENGSYPTIIIKLI